MALTIGDSVPDFTANSTLGEIKFHEVSEGCAGVTCLAEPGETTIVASEPRLPATQFLGKGPGWTLML